MVAFIVGNGDPDIPILTSSDMPGQRPSDRAPEEASIPEEPEQCLIPGLPDAVARKCLARVPFWFHARSVTWPRPRAFQGAQAGPRFM